MISAFCNAKWHGLLSASQLSVKCIIYFNFIVSKLIKCCAISIACLSAVYVCIGLTVQSQTCSHSDSTSTYN